MTVDRKGNVHDKGGKFAQKWVVHKEPIIYDEAGTISTVVDVAVPDAIPDAVAYYEKQIAALKAQQARLQQAMDGFSIAMWDIETPHLKADFGFVMCGSFLTFGGEPEIFRIDNFPGYKRDICDDRAICLAMRDRLEQFDMIVTYNGLMFDFKFLNTRLLYHRERKIAPIFHLDLMYTPKYQLVTHSASLDATATFLKLKESKTKLLPDVWMRASHGHRDAMDEVVNHNIQDVYVLRDAYIELKPYIRNIYKRY